MKRTVLIATPAYGGMVTTAYMQSVLDAAATLPDDGISIATLLHHGESLVTRARNHCVSRFLESGCTDLLFIDADIDFAPENILRLVRSEHDVAAAPYPLKKVGAGTVVNAIGPIEDDGFCPAEEAGTGFMLIRRPVIEEMIQRYGMLAYWTDQHGEPGRKAYALFDTSLHMERYLSEDYTFCRRWRKLGGKIMVDRLGPPLGHFGSYRYGE